MSNTKSQIRDIIMDFSNKNLNKDQWRITSNDECEKSEEIANDENLKF